MVEQNFHIVASPYRRRLNVFSCVTLPCRPRLNVFSLPLLLVILVISGCGTGEYERRLKDRTNRLRTELNFNELYAPQPLSDTPASVRVPVLFKDSPLVEGAPDKDGKPADPRRVKPVLFDLPWLKLTYEGFVDAPEGGKLSYYCYVAAVDRGAGDPSAAWSGVLSNKGGALEDWADFQGQTPDGRTVAWKKLRFTGPQEFYTINVNGQEQYKQLPGVLEIYLQEQAGLYVLIAWRMPESIEPQVDPAKWARMMTGCTSISQ